MEEQGGGAIVSALCWVDRGYAKAMLEEYQPTQEEFEKLKKIQKKAKSKNQKKKQKKEPAADDASSNDSMQGDDMPFYTSELSKLKEKEMKQMAGGKMDATDQDDQMKDENPDNEGDEDNYVDDIHPDEYSDSEEEKDDQIIRKTDSLIVAATAENDHSNLEVYIYDHKTSDLYVHHEIMLGAYPLCLEWLPEWQKQKSNNVIVGTFLPEIEIWNLDTEACEPIAILGNIEESTNYNEGKLKGKSLESLNTHVEAVMCMSLNPVQKEYLASGSEDKTVRIWDLDELQCKAVFSKIHTDKVQAVKWNQVNDKVLLTAGYDRIVNVFDVRNKDSLIKTKIPKAVKDVESVYWHPNLEHNFGISTESGCVLGYDTRKLSEPIFLIQAHEKQCSNLVFSKHIPNMMCTSSTDGTVKVWDILANSGTEPKLIGKRDMGQGELYSMRFCNDIPWVVACGGSNGEPAVWDTSETKAIEKHFKSFLVEGSYKQEDYNVNDANVEHENDYESMSDDEDEEKPKKKKKKTLKVKK